MDDFQALNKIPELGEFVHLVPIAIPAICGLVVLCLDIYLKGSKAPLAQVTAG
jgi:hypothetical protein